MNTKDLPTLEYLNECFELDQNSKSGLRWKSRPHKHFATYQGWAMRNSRDKGKPAGYVNANPKTGKQYFEVGIAGSTYSVHRIVYSIYHNEVLPLSVEIDHRDGNGLNNRITNLRKATPNENRQYGKLRADNTSGVKGVHWHKQHASWYGKVNYKRKPYYTGFSPSKEVIIELVQELREKLHKEFTHHG